MTKAALVRLLLIISCLIGGALAGGNVYRYIIEVPAWRHLNIDTWAVYSQYADLSNGIFLFPAEAIGSALPVIIASVICMKSEALKTRFPLIYISTAFAIVGLVLTFFAAPIMLNVPNRVGNIALLQEAFNRFHFWGALRAIAQILGFFFCVLALAGMQKSTILK